VLLAQQSELETGVGASIGSKDGCEAIGPDVDERFRHEYVNAFTDAHADELNALRNVSPSLS
jgi:hypothetical protein